jgi:hypothetical protein
MTYKNDEVFCSTSVPFCKSFKYTCALIINLIFQQCSRIFLSFIIYRFLHSKYKHLSKINKSDLLTPPPVFTKNNVLKI